MGQSDPLEGLGSIRIVHEDDMLSRRRPS